LEWFDDWEGQGAKASCPSWPLQPHLRHFMCHSHYHVIADRLFPQDAGQSS